MSTKAERGTKRTCQNPECGARFYDLSRDPVTCPICQTVYRIEPQPVLAAPETGPNAEKAARRSKKPVYAAEHAKAEDVPEAEGDDALVPIEDDDAEPVVAEEDETFLEAEEEDGTDMSNIIGPVAEDDERP